ncbi:unnamed protein product [Symbiodinium sp. CCMP2456]|nr:unnamed protein product [Symbiodinium sp. CCMP2456]
MSRCKHWRQMTSLPPSTCFSTRELLKQRTKTWRKWWVLRRLWRCLLQERPSWRRARDASGAARSTVLRQKAVLLTFAQSCVGVSS